MPKNSAKRPGFDVLSDREHEIVGHLAQGRATLAIAKAMQISDNTVRAHVQNVLRKLGMKSRVEVVVHAFKSGVVVR